MDEAQTNAIESNMAALCSAIESDMFMTFLRIKSLLERNECELIRNEITNEAKIIRTFDFLMLKKGSWGATIEFLQKHKYIDVAAKLNRSADSVDSVALQMELLQVGQNTSDWRQFIKDAVGKDLDPSNWQQTELLKNLGSLALLGVIKNQFQFNQAEMQMCNVRREDFHSGLLQYHSDPIGLTLKSDFPHRSIQDFLAAFYAVHYWGDKTLMEATGWPEEIWPWELFDFLPHMKVEMLMAQVLQSDSQFCRFFFGLISGRDDFSDRYRLILAEMFGHFTTALLNPFWIVFVGCDLADCSDEEKFVAGQIANDLADLMTDICHPHPTELEEKKIKFRYGVNRDWRTISLSSLFGQLTKHFRRGMKVSRIGNWSFSFGSENPQNLKIFYFHVDDQDILEDIGKLLPFSHIGHIYVRMEYSLYENLVTVRQILSHILSVDSLTILESNQRPCVNLLISVDAQNADSPKLFSLKYLRVSVSSEIDKKMLEKLQSPTHFQSEKIKVSSVEKWRFFNRFSIAIVVDNNMSNVDIFNAIGAD